VHGRRHEQHSGTVTMTTASSTATPRRYARRGGALAWLLPSLAVLGALLLWQVFTALPVVPDSAEGWRPVFRPSQFPTALDSLTALGRALAGPDLWRSVGLTLTAWILGMLVTVVAGVVVGSLLAFNEFAARSAAPVIEIVKAIPAIAILPVVIMTPLQNGMGMKVFLIAFAAFWPFVIQVMYGVRSTDPVALDTARANGITGVRRFFSVTVPSASPYLVTGMRIASAQALILAIISELVGGADGIGRQILLAENNGIDSYPQMYAYIIVSGLLGLVLTGALFLMERRVMHWHESQRSIRAGGDR